VGLRTCRSPPVSNLETETSDILISGYARKARCAEGQSSLRNMIKNCRKDGPGPMGGRVADINPHFRHRLSIGPLLHIPQRSDGRKGRPSCAHDRSLLYLPEIDPVAIQSLSILPGRERATMRRVPYQPSHL